MVSARALSLLALCALACGSGPSTSPGHPTTAASGGGFGPTGGTLGGTGGSGGAQGNNSLDGPLGFVPQDAFAMGTQTSVLTVDLTDGYSGCSESGAYQAVRVSLFFPGAAPTYGTYSVDGGAQVELWTGSPGALALAASAHSGQVTLNELSPSLGGNFSVELAPSDGGAASTLSGIFSAAICN